jgi:hypothetical protein
VYRKHAGLHDEEELQVFMGAWKNLRRSETVELFNAALEEFESTLNQRMLAYFRKEWLPYSSYFVHAWTKQLRHYGHYVDSRIEKLHHQLKQHVTGPSRLSFHGLLAALALYTAQQLAQIEEAESYDAISVPRKLQTAPMVPVNRRISSYALGQVHDRVMVARASINTNTALAPCNGEFTCTMGMPCTHKLKELLILGEHLTFSGMSALGRGRSPWREPGCMCCPRESAKKTREHAE